MFGSRGMTYSTYVVFAMQAPRVDLCELGPLPHARAVRPRAGSAGETMLPKDEPLDVRERFLVRSEEFFRA